MVRHASFVLVIGLTLIACSACSSVPNITFGDGGSSGASGAPAAPCSGPEICDDGIDNDCDGRTDCEDGACRQGFTCQDVPQGWTAVAFAGAMQPGCPASETPTDLKVASGDGSAECSCTCTGVGGSCATGNFTLSMSTEVTCGVAATTGSVAANGTNCTALNAPITIPGGARAKVTPPAAPTSCAPNATVDGALTSGRVCEATRVGKGCDANEACVPRSTGGLQGCISKLGKQACPPGFNKRSTAGTSAVDSRTCTGCTCGAATPCVGGSASLYESTTCRDTGGNSVAENISTTCNTTSDDDFTATHFRSTPPSGGCNAMPIAQANAGGTLTFTGERTICCR